MEYLRAVSLVEKGIASFDEIDFTMQEMEYLSIDDFVRIHSYKQEQIDKLRKDKQYTPYDDENPQLIESGCYSASGSNELRMIVSECIPWPHHIVSTDPMGSWIDIRKYRLDMMQANKEFNGSMYNGSQHYFLNYAKENNIDTELLEDNSICGKNLYQIIKHIEEYGYDRESIKEVLHYKDTPSLVKALVRERLY